MPEDANPSAFFLQMRDELFRELADAEQECAQVRVAVERMESDLRIGRPEPAEYAETKGHLLPRAERRIIEAYQQLLKLEDKIAGRA